MTYSELKAMPIDELVEIIGTANELHAEREAEMRRKK